MKPSASFNIVINKAHQAFKQSPDADWDYPNYGSNLTATEIASLSCEHVDAIQHTISMAQSRASQGKRVPLTWFEKTVTEQYETITPP